MNYGVWLAFVTGLICFSRKWTNGVENYATSGFHPFTFANDLVITIRILRRMSEFPVGNNEIKLTRRWILEALFIRLIIMFV